MYWMLNVEGRPLIARVEHSFQEAIEIQRTLITGGQAKQPGGSRVSNQICRVVIMTEDRNQF